MGRWGPSEPLYLIGDVEVMSENFSGKYVMVRVRARPDLFPNTSIIYGKQYIQRARVVMTVHLGRPIRSDEHVHHKRKKFMHRDTIANLEVLSSEEHNKHHHAGLKHKPAVKARISASLRKFYEERRYVA